jgi:hypothetical protein
VLGEDPLLNAQENYTEKTVCYKMSSISKKIMSCLSICMAMSTTKKNWFVYLMNSLNYVLKLPGMRRAE